MVPHIGKLGWVCVMSVEITDPGLYRSDRNLTDVTIEFNSSVAIDQILMEAKTLSKGKRLAIPQVN